MTVLEPVINYILTCRRKELTLQQVMAGADRPRRPVLRVLDRLVKEGSLIEIEDNKARPGLGEFGPNRRNPSWRVISLPQLPCLMARRLTVRDKVWKALQTSPRCTQNEIMTVTGAKEKTVRNYLSLLLKAGYLRVTGKDGHSNVYMLTNGHGKPRPEIREEIRKEFSRQSPSGKSNQRTETETKKSNNRRLINKESRQ